MVSMKWSRFVVCVLSLCGCPVWSIATEITESVGVSIVEVPVYVWDEKGDPVTGLTQRDFEVFEDGQKRQIEVFFPIAVGRRLSEIPRDSRSVLPQKPELPRYETRRHFFVVFDYSYNSLAGARRMFDAAGSFVDSGLREGDLVSLWVISPIRGLVMISNFTSDRTHLRDCVRALQSGGRLFQSEKMPGLADLTGSAWAQESTSDEMGDSVPPLLAELEAHAVESFLDEMERLARIVSGMPGRKSCLLFSEGFKLAPGCGGLHPEILEHLDRVTHIFSTADCQLFSFETRGLYSESNLDFVDRPSGRGRLFSSTLASLTMLADQTGGECFMNSNDLSKPVRQMSDQTSQYYILGYRPPARASIDDPKKYHDIDVRVRRDNVRVRHRPGYSGSPEVGPTEPERILLQIAAIALYDLQEDAITFRPAAYTVPVSKDRARAAVAFEIPGAQLRVGSGDLPLEFYVFVLDRDEQIVTYTRGEQTISSSDLESRVPQTGVRYTDLVELPGTGEFQLRFVVRNANDGTIGTATLTSVIAPPWDRTCIVGPIFPAGSPEERETTEWLNYRGFEPKASHRQRGNLEESNPFTWAGTHIGPDLNPLRKSGPWATIVKLHPAHQETAPREIALSCEVLDSTDTVIARPDISSTLRAQVVGEHIEYMFTLDLGEVRPNAASVRIIAVDRKHGDRLQCQAHLR